MLVRNPTSGTITYNFATLTLTPGQTAEIDNSFVENTEFQLAQNSNTISVIKYEQDLVHNTIEIYTGLPPTSPSISQKGAMVCANSPSPTNVFLTMRDMNNYFDGYVTNTSEVFTANIFKLIIGDIKIVSIAPTFNVLTGHSIDANGNTTGETLPPETQSNLYISNQGLLRGSAVTVTNTNWQFLGKFYTDANGEIVDFDYYTRQNKVVSFTDEITENLDMEIPIIDLRSKSILITFDFDWNGIDQEFILDGTTIRSSTGEVHEHFSYLKSDMTSFETLALTTTGITSLSNFICHIVFL